MKKVKSLLTFGRGRVHWPLRICVFILVLWAIGIILYLFGVAWNFLYPTSQHQLLFNILDQLLARLSNPWTVGLLLFLVKAFSSDSDHDGIPDALEDTDKFIKPNMAGGARQDGI